MFESILWRCSPLHERRECCCSAARPETAHILESLIGLAVEIAREGREGRRVGTLITFDVRDLLRQGAQTGVFELAEQQIVERMFQFADRCVSAIMTPRSDIVWLDINDDRCAWRREISGSPYSRFPVCDGNLDHVIGILHAKEFLTAPENLEIRSFLQPPITVPEQTPALKVLENFRQTTVHIALVIDEYGGVHGLVSSTDILEALVGELPDMTPLGAEPCTTTRWVLAR